VRELELGGDVGREIGVEDAERVKVGGVVTSDLVRSDEQLDLEKPKRGENVGNGVS
jgi:hypothetical protein